MRRYLFPVLLGLAGCAVLASLGVWQMQRLAWKEALLARISSQIDGPVQPLPDPGDNPGVALKYRPVQIAGQTTGQEILVLSGRKGQGAGYRVIAAFALSAPEGGTAAAAGAAPRRILLDRGFLPEAGRAMARPAVPLTVAGNLHWPEETDRYTPPPDAATGLWFARDVPAMAAALGTEPVLVVARDSLGDAQGILPSPLGVEGIPNDHLSYALTWFLLTIVWAGMTAFLLWRIRRQKI